MKLQVNFCFSPESGPKANLSISESFYKPLQYLSKLQLIFAESKSLLRNTKFEFPISSLFNTRTIWKA